MTGFRYNKIPMIISSALGAIYTVLMAVYSFVPIWFSLPGKICISVAMVLMAYLPESMGQFFKGSSCFYICSFVLAGAVMAIDKEYSLVVPAVFIGVMLLLIGIRCIKSGRQGETIVDIEIHIKGEGPMVIKALADTGCSLVDPIDGTPVIVLHDKSMKIPQNSKRLIPYSTISDSGILEGTRIDRVIVHWEKYEKEIKGPIVCPVDRPLGGGKYMAIISADAFK